MSDTVLIQSCKTITMFSKVQGVQGHYQYRVKAHAWFRTYRDFFELGGIT